MLQDASRLDYIRKDGSGHKVRVRRRLVETTQKGVRFHSCDSLRLVATEIKMFGDVR